MKRYTSPKITDHGDVRAITASNICDGEAGKKVAGTTSGPCISHVMHEKP